MAQVLGTRRAARGWMVLGLAAVAAAASGLPARADDAQVVDLTLKDNKFSQTEITLAAGKAATLNVVNLDATPAEFECKPLRIEKVIPAGGKITVPLRALQPGTYKFVDEYHEDVTFGVITVK